MTANAMKTDLDACLAAGMDDFIPKPIDRRLLFEKLRTWVSPTATRFPAATAPAEPPPPLRAVPRASRTSAGAGVGAGLDLDETAERLGIPREAVVRMWVRFSGSAPGMLEELRAALAGTERDGVARSDHYGAGRVNAARAVAAAVRSGKAKGS